MEKTDLRSSMLMNQALTLADQITIDRLLAQSSVGLGDWFAVVSAAAGLV